MKWEIQATVGSVLDLHANSFSELDYLEMLALNSSIKRYMSRFRASICIGNCFC